MDSIHKIIQFQQLQQWRKDFEKTGKKLIVTNGCFDLLHVGHVTYLEQARSLGDCLLVGVNSDRSVRALKGEGRPINSEEDRAIMLAALESVTAVCVFPDKAERFLAAVKPDVWVKGGDYTLQSLDQNEVGIVQYGGGSIQIIPMRIGVSTTRLVEKITKLKNNA